jgi:hypothetical protein
MRSVLLVAAFLLALASGARAGGPQEVGFIEDFTLDPGAYTLTRGGKEIAVAVLLPLQKDDVIIAKGAGARMVIQLSDRPDPKVITDANGAVSIDDAPPTHHYFSGLFAWTASSVAILDHDQREEVAASIRGNDVKLSAPILSSPQTLAAGRRALSIGWLSPSAVNVSITRAGKPVAAGRGVGGLWTSPVIDLTPGAYQIQIAARTQTIAQTLNVRPAEPLPDELVSSAAPDALRETETAAYLAARGPSYALEALQHVAGAGDFRAAQILSDALIAGKRLAPPP